MNAFNKLYNLILESIITQNKASRKAMLQKYEYDRNVIDWVIDFLDNYDNKTGDFLCRYIADKTLKSWTDSRIEKVEKIININPSIDTQSYKGTLDQFIEQYSDSITKHQQKQAAKTIEFLDNIPQFSQKEECVKGVVIYKVQNDWDGMEAVRKIVDMQWRKDANPWCLIARKNGELDQAYNMWKNYNAVPKHIAFQNGKLIAFCANTREETLWWDRNDESTPQLKLLDGSFMQTPKYKWTNDEKVANFLEKNPDLVYNEQTKKYDCDFDINIWDEDLTDGHFPIDFGVIKGDFNCEDIHPEYLTSLYGAPTKVTQTFRCTGNFKTLAGAPQYVGHSMVLTHCRNLQSLEGGPKYIGGNLCLNYINKLTSLKGAPEKIEKGIHLMQCYSLQSLEGSPKIVNGHVSIYKCNKLKTLKGGPRFIKDTFEVEHCDSIVDLQGAPQYVGGDFMVVDCQNLEDKFGEPQKVIGNKVYKRCPKLGENNE